MVRPVALALLAGTALAMPGSALAQGVGAGEEEIRGAVEEIIVTGRRVARPVSAIPGAVSVIDQAELTDQFAITENLSNLLAFNVPGFAAQGTTLQSRAVLRGRTALILVDGVPQNTLLRSNGFDIQTVAPEAIERVEVIRGASAVYGFGATGGIVNFITKRPGDEPEAFVKLGTEFQTSRADPALDVYGQISGRLGEVGAVFGVGFDDFGVAYDGRGEPLPNGNSEYGKNILNLHGSVEWAITDDHELRATGSYFKRREDADDFVAIAAVGDPVTRTLGRGVRTPFLLYDGDLIFGGAEPVDPTTLGVDLVPGEMIFQNYTLTYTASDVFGSSVEVQGLYHRFTEQQQFLLFDGLLSRGDRRNERLGVRLTVETPLDFALDGARLIWGGDWLDNDVDEGDIIPGESQTFPDRNRTSPLIEQISTGFFAQVEVPLGDFLLSGGVRHERYSVELGNAQFTFGEAFFAGGGFDFIGGEIDYDSTVFNAGLVWYATPDLDLFFGFSEGLDVTQVGRAASQVASAAQINPEPAVTRNFEVGTRGTLAGLDFQVSAFYADSELASRTRPNPGGLALPLRQPEEIWGVEVVGDYEVTDTLRVGGNFTWLNGVRELGDGTEAPVQNQFLTPLSIAGTVTWQPLGWLETRAQVYQTFASDDFESEEFGEGDFEEQTRIDLLLRARLDRYGTLEFGVNNLFDDVYVSPGDLAYNLGDQYFAVPGRTLSIAYNYRFGL